MCLALCSGAQQKPATGQPVSEPRVKADYGALPLAFEANGGQTDARVRFVARGEGYSLFLTESEAVLALHSSTGCKPAKALPGRKPSPCAAEPAARQDSVRMKLAGASVGAAQPSGDAELPGKVNYFIGNDPAKWHAGLPTYAKVRYAAVYPGIDLLYYGNQRQLEYDFVVAPQASPAPIRLQFDGAKRLRIEANGDLVLKGAYGEATFHEPVIYQNDKDGQRQPVAGQFKMVAKNTVGFTLGSYDRTRAVVIDPVLAYSTYLGGSIGDVGNGVAVDSAGSAYVVGGTGSTDFPVTSGAYQVAKPGKNSTAFVTKFNAAGTALIYSTYLGGTGGDNGRAIALDAENNAYLTGATSSADFPVTTGAYSKTAAPLFVTKLNAAGDGLVYSTFIGNAEGLAIAVDGTGHAYITGSTAAANFPVTAGAFQTRLPSASTTGSPCAFVTKLNPAGSALVYSTYLGGTGYTDANTNSPSPYGDTGNGIAVDVSGSAYVTGKTYSGDFPVTSGAFQSGNPSYNPYCVQNGFCMGGPGTNAFVTKLNPAGTQEVYSTYLGGSGFLSGTQPQTLANDSGNAIAVDAAGNAYVAGFASSTDFPVTAGVVFNSVLVEYWPGFVTKFNAAGSALLYSTFLSYDSYVTPTGLAVDGGGHAYVVGNGGSVPETQDALVSPYKPLSTFVLKLNASATAMEYATALGGSNSESAAGLALDAGGDVFVTGYSQSKDFPTTSGAFQTVNKAPTTSSNAYVSKFALGGNTTDSFGTQTANSVSAAIVEQGQPVTLTAKVTATGGTTKPTGQLEFQGVYFISGQFDVNLPPVVVTLDGNGVGTWTTSSLKPGDYQITSIYAGDGKHLSSWATAAATIAQFTVAGPPAQLLASSAQMQKVPYGTAFSDLVVVVTDGRGIAVPGVTVNFSGPGLQFTPASVLTNAGGGADVKVAALAHSVSKYVATASVGGLTTKFSLSIVPAPLTVTVNPATRLYGAANPAFTDTVTGLVYGETVTVSNSTTATPASSVGTYPLTATPAGAALANYAVTIINGNLTVTPAPLNVTVHPGWRLYGASNPSFVTSVAGLVNGDTLGGTVIVNSQTSAKPASPVGTYPVTPSVSGSAAKDYTLTAIGSTLSVLPVRLSVLARSVAVTYGQTPAPPTAYTLTGFVNGETASVVTGAPVLSTTVTSTTPAGGYKIQVGLGTLSAQNYTFVAGSQGGYVQVYKRMLALSANNVTMHKGQPVPPLTYTLAGFVNGDTASVVSGAPVLTTTVTSNTLPGRYMISVQNGSLTAANYAFPWAGIGGVLTVLP